MSNPIKGKCIIVAAPSGAGKTTVVKSLLKEFPELSFSISACSRAPRPNEKNGEDYYFLSAGDFKNRIDSGDFLEWEEVYENQFYGTLKSEIDRIWLSGKHVIFDVDVIGALNLKKYFGDKALNIFVMPPSIDVLEKRLRSRNTETNENLQKRIQKAEKELEKAKSFDVIILNDDLKTALNEAKELVRKFIGTL